VSIAPMKTVYFITHPDVVIDPAVPVPQWPLSERGRTRMQALLTQPWVATITAIYSSTERKAREGAAVLAQHRALPVHQVAALGENDRSATGFLPPQEFEAIVAQFFAHPEVSIRGWEPAAVAQQRIVSAVTAILAHDPTPGALAMVSHGGVGTLLLCHLAGHPINRRYAQPGANGGNYYAFTATAQQMVVIHGWRAIDVVDQVVSP
jgi:broad specificity phosphatase PhoE